MCITERVNEAFTYKLSLKETHTKQEETQHDQKNKKNHKLSFINGKLLQKKIYKETQHKHRGVQNN